MGVSGQRHAPAALWPWERTPDTHCTGGWVGPRAGLDTEDRGNILCLCWGSNLNRPVIQSVARHYTELYVYVRAYELKQISVYTLIISYLSLIYIHKICVRVRCALPASVELAFCFFALLVTGSARPIVRSVHKHAINCLAERYEQRQQGPHGVSLCNPAYRTICEICFHGGEDDDVVLLGYDTV
jgi:hypothetical protein